MTQDNYKCITIADYKEGDVFRWRYSKEHEEQFGNVGCGVYHCKAKIATYKNDHTICDNYFHSSRGEIFQEDIESGIIEVAYICNMEDIKHASGTDKIYYEPECFIDLRHPNDSGEFYIRKDAQRSLRLMELYRECEIEYKEEELERLKSELERLKSEPGVTTDTHLSYDGNIHSCLFNWRANKLLDEESTK